MKTSFLFAVVLFAFSQIGFAQSVRKCSNETLSCELISDNRVIETATAKWDGFNYDEPSIEPYYCSMNVWLEAKDADLVFEVRMTDDNNVASVYNQNLSRLGRVLEGSASISVVAGKPFYFSRGDLKLKCVLN